MHTHDVALVGLVDERGWLLMQERDEHADIDPDRWGLVGGAIEAGESPPEAAARELTEETGLVHDDLVVLGTFVLPCSLPDTEDVFHVYTARTSVTDVDVVCTEGRQIVFVDPARFPDLDLTASARLIAPDLLAAHRDVIRPGRPGDRDG